MAYAAGFGSWRVLFTTLLLCGLALLAGCRPAGQPRRGWARLAVLADQHPNRAMLDDLDHRLQGLEDQRAKLLGDAAGPAAPAQVTEATPAVPALPAPARAALPASPSEQVDTQALSVLRRTLTRQAERNAIRAERTLRAESDAKLAKTRAALRAAADAALDAAAKEEGATVLSLELKREYAARRLAATNNLVRDMRQRGVAATAQAKAERQFAAQYPRDARVQARAEKAEAYAASTARRLASLQEQAAVQTEELVIAAANLADATAHRQARYAEIDETMQRNLDVAAAKSTAAMKARLAELRDAATHDIQQQVAKEADRLAEARRRELPPAPAPEVSFPALPAGELRLETKTVETGVRQAEAKAGRTVLVALADIERGMQDLRSERAKVAAEITAETRTLAVAVAAKHGVILTLNRRDGAEVTAQLQSWLGAFWPK